MPPGWALRNPVISSTHTSRTSVSGTGPTPTAAVLTKAHTGRLSTAVGSADDSDTPDEKDIRMVFEDISSSSGEFDLLKHRHREKQ